MSSHSTNLGTSRAQTPEQDENEREPLENASRAPTVEPVRRNLTKSDLNTLLSKQDEVIEKQDARMDRQDQMMEALLA